jgi:hypothetical protein
MSVAGEHLVDSEDVKDLSAKLVSCDVERTFSIYIKAFSIKIILL